MHENLPIALPHRAVLTLTGADKITFLQGIVTNDVTALSVQHPLYACMLTPQGKFLYDMFLVMVEDTIYMDIAAAEQEALLKRLMMYKLRADVSITPAPELKVAISCHTEQSEASEKILHCVQDESGIHYPDPRDATFGMRMIIAAGKPTQENNEAYHAVRIAHGIPEAGVELIKEEAFPLHYRLDAFHAISFTKGCYVGQEVTARMKHRDAVRKTLVRLTSATPFTHLTEVTQAGRVVGKLCSFAGCHALALIESEAIASEKIMAGAMECVVAKGE